MPDEPIPEWLPGYVQSELEGWKEEAGIFGEDYLNCFSEEIRQRIMSA